MLHSRRALFFAIHAGDDRGARTSGWCTAHHRRLPRPNDALLAVADLLGIMEFARVGGAQAVAAMAYGTRQIAPVEKICGPGNRFVTAAKQIVSADCAIDMPAGPTEAVVLANSGNAKWIAADLLAQAEHAPNAELSDHPRHQNLRVRCSKKSRRNWRPCRKQIPRTNRCAQREPILVARLITLCEFVNRRFAPEHLSLPIGGEKLLLKIKATGTIFLGPLSAQPFGDYASGLAITSFPQAAGPGVAAAFLQRTS